MVLDERDQNDRYSGDLIVCSLQMLLLTILRNGEKTETRLKTPASLQNENSIINAALTYISANARKKLSVPLVAKSSNVSVSRLTKLFQERLAITPGEYIRRVKLEESRALIKAGEGNVSQIAELLQYSTVQHFSRQFKAKFGVSPSEFAPAEVLTRLPELSPAGQARVWAAIAQVWQAREDRYSEIRTADTAALRKIEMSYIGG